MGFIYSHLFNDFPKDTCHINASLSMVQSTMCLLCVWIRKRCEGMIQVWKKQASGYPRALGHDQQQFNRPDKQAEFQ